MPAGHSWHVSDSAGDHRPAVQLVQLPAPVCEYVFWGHVQHVGSSASAQRPAVQLVHSPVTGSVDVPLRQPKHRDELLGLYWYDSQAVQLASPSLDRVLGGHGRHSLAAVPEYQPSGQMNRSPSTQYVPGWGTGR